jgi:hypothetical protein
MNYRKLLKAYPELAKIDLYSKNVAALFYKSRPHWLGYAAPEEYKGRIFLKIAIPMPNNPDDKGLIINTDSHRVTVFFYGYHAHFGGWRGMTAQDAFDGAMKYVDKLRREEYVVGCWVDEEYGVVSGRCYLTEDIETVQPGEISYIRSWLGTYDRNYEE